MAIQKEIWIADIRERLYEQNEFITQSVSHDGFVSNKTVHVPISGTSPTIYVDRGTLPATISQRTDADHTYSLRQFTTDPILVTDLEDLQVNYSKRQSILGQHIDALNERLGTETLHSWALTTSTFVLTGVTAGGTLPPSATGTRTKFTRTDIAALAAKLDKDNVPKAGRNIIMPVDLYYELLSVDELVRKDFVNNAALPDGAIDRLFGFNIYVRPTVVMYDGSQNLKAVNAAAAATDCYGVIAWHPNFVSKAMGGIKVFSDIDKPEYYGSIFSAEVMHGSVKLSPDSSDFTDFTTNINAWRGVAAWAQS